MKKPEININDTRRAQAIQLIQAAKIRCPDAMEFENLMVEMLQSVLEHPWIDEEIENNIREYWIKLVGAKALH